MVITGWKICAQVFLDATLDFLFFKLKMEQSMMSNIQSPAFAQKDLSLDHKDEDWRGAFCPLQSVPWPKSVNFKWYCGSLLQCKGDYREKSLSWDFGHGPDTTVRQTGRA